MIHVWRDPAIDGVVIANEIAPGLFVLPDGNRTVRVEPHEQRPAWMVLNSLDARELARALNRELPWGDEAREALHDARQVRDRLLTLVEGFALPPRLIDYGPQQTAGTK